MKMLRTIGLFCFLLLLSVTSSLWANTDTTTSTLPEIEQEVIDIRQEIGAISQKIEGGVSTGNWLIVFMIVLVATSSLYFAASSRNKLLDKVEDRDEFAKFLMQQTLGLPQGTVRGVLALVVAMVYVGAVLCTQMKKSPRWSK